jgi:hypothetical protein
MFYQTKKNVRGHIKVLGGPHVARGPDVAQAWFRPSSDGQYFAHNVATKIIFLFFLFLMFENLTYKFLQQTFTYFLTVGKTKM